MWRMSRHTALPMNMSSGIWSMLAPPRLVWQNASIWVPDVIDHAEMKVVQPPSGSSGVPLPQLSISSWVKCGMMTGRGKNLWHGMLLVSGTDKSTIVRAMLLPRRERVRPSCAVQAGGMPSTRRAPASRSRYLEASLTDRTNIDFADDYAEIGMNNGVLLESGGDVEAWISALGRAMNLRQLQYFVVVSELESVTGRPSACMSRSPR